MAGPHFNVLATTKQPREAAIGMLADDAKTDAVTKALVAAGIETDRIHFMSGEEGALLIENAGSAMSRLLDTERQMPIAALRAGKTLVAVFGTDVDHVDQVKAAFEQAQVSNRAYFGKWTIS